MVLLSLIFVVAGGLFVAIGVATRRSSRRFERTAERVAATVTDVRSRAVGRGSGGGLIWIPVVRFQTADGRVVEAETAGGTNVRRHEPGQAVQVLYDPANPSNTRVPGGPPGTVFGASFVVLGSGLVLLGLALLAVFGALDVG